MPARRPLATALTGIAVLLGLAGCQKPSPGVTLVSAGSSVHSQAVEFCRGATFLTNGNECPGTGKGVTVLQVGQGELVGIDVDKKLADTGWYIYDADAQQRSAVKSKLYASFIADFTNRPVAGVINLEVREVDHQPTSNTDAPKLIGQWKFQLVQKQ